MSTFSLEKLVNAAFTSDLNQPFPVESYCEKFYNSKKTKNHSTEYFLHAICLQIESYKKLLSTKIAQCTDLKHLLEATVEPFLVGLQRLIEFCCSLQRRVHLAIAENDVQLKTTLATVELTINKTGLCLLVKVLTEHSTLLMKIIKNKLTSLFEESCSKKSNSKLTELMSKLAQYILVLELRLSSFQVDQAEKSSSFSFDSIFCHSLFDCLQDFNIKISAQLLLTCRKEKIINWRLYLESLINLWSTSLKPTLYVAFVQKLPNKPYKYCDPILPLTAKDVTVLLSQRDRIQEKAQIIFYSVALPEKKLSSLLKYIGESFVVIVQSRTKINKSNSSKRFNTHELFTLIHHYYNINSTLQSISIFFAEIDVRFSHLLLEKTTTKDRNENKHHQIKNSMHDYSTSTHLNKIQYLAIYERLLRCLLKDYLYNSSACWQIIRTLMCRHVNDSQQQTQQSSFAKCLAGFMHYNLSSVHNNEPLDFTWLENCIHLLGYLTNSRPTFERQYTFFLGKRLLSPNILYLNKERFVAYQLAIEYDLEMAVYSAHLEQMLRDVDVNSCEQYVHQYSVSTPVSRIDKQLHLKVNILTPLLWEEIVLPKECLKDCLTRASPYLPKEVLSALNNFKDFYRKSGCGLKTRKLIQHFSIKHNWAVIELITSQLKTDDQSQKMITTGNTRSNDGDGPQILVTAAQVMLLQWLTDAERISTDSTTFGRLQLAFKEILSQSELNRALRLLLHFGVFKFKLTGNSKQLKRQHFEDDSFACSDDDQLVFCEPEEMTFANNSNSICNFTSLKVGSSLEVLNSRRSASKCDRSRASKEALTEAEIEQQYHLTIDAAIVHIAKKNGQLLYQSLVDQVLAYLTLKTCFQGVPCTASIIDRRMVKLHELELVTAEPAKLDTQTRSNVIKYCIIT